MHGTIDKRKRSVASGKTVRARLKVRARAGLPVKRVAGKGSPVEGSVDEPLVLRVSPRLNRALSKVAARTEKPKHYHVRRALERYLEDTWDYLDAVESMKTTRRTYTLDEVRKRLGMDR